jgi:hypothetical protein
MKTEAINTLGELKYLDTKAKSIKDEIIWETE